MKDRSSWSDAEKTAQVGIIGAGPIGIELAVACKAAGLSVLHFDARQIGYTISWFAPQTQFFSSNERIAIAGVPLQTAAQGKASREEYLAYLRCVVEQFDLRIHTYEPIVGIDRDSAGFRLTTAPATGERAYVVKHLVLATGGTDKPRRLNIPGEDLPHVSHYFQDPHLYFRKKLLIVGGKNSAVEAAIRCHRAGAHVAVSYRRDAIGSNIKYWLLPEINGLIESGAMAGHFGTEPVEISAGRVTLRGRDGRSSVIEADFVLLLTGYEADMSICKMAGVELIGECQRPRFDPQTMQTNIPDLYIAGTATGGTQDKYTVFIENCHVHVQRIIAAMTRQRLQAPLAAPEYARPES